MPNRFYQAATNPPFTITHQFLTNGNLYLPLASLTEFQKRGFDPATSSAAVKAANANLLAAGMGHTNYTPPLETGDPEVRALASLFAHQSGVEAIPATMQYLNERKQMEVSFQQHLAGPRVTTSYADSYGVRGFAHVLVGMASAGVGDRPAEQGLGIVAGAGFDV